jgi:hypothetical protein
VGADRALEFLLQCAHVMHDCYRAREKSDPLSVALQPVVPSITPMTSCATVPTTISESAVETLNQIASSIATNANPTHKAERAHAFVMEPSVLNCVQGSLPGQDSATGFPVRSHHLSSLAVLTPHPCQAANTNPYAFRV